MIFVKVRGQKSKTKSERSFEAKKSEKGQSPIFLKERKLYKQIKVLISAS